MIVEPAKGVGRALYTALDQFADSERRPELRTAPLIAMGWSGAGSLVGRLAGYRAERYLAGIAYAPGQYEPLGMDTIELSQAAIRMPQLIIANGGDNINGTERNGHMDILRSTLIKALRGRSSFKIEHLIVAYRMHRRLFSIGYMAS